MLGECCGRLKRRRERQGRGERAETCEVNLLPGSRGQASPHGATLFLSAPSICVPQLANPLGMSLGPPTLEQLLPDVLYHKDNPSPKV